MKKIKEILCEIIELILIVVACRFEIMGCYPLLPAAVGNSCINNRKKVPMYCAAVTGIMLFVEPNVAVKYLCIVVLCRIGIGFYIWGNQSCSGFAAGVIAGIATIAMNVSGQMLAALSPTELVLGFGEGLLVAGITVIINYCIGFLESIDLDRNDFWIPQTSAGEIKIRAMANAIEGLSVAITGMAGDTAIGKEEKINALESEVTGRVCACCDVCAVCWNENRTSLRNNLRKMIWSVVEHGNNSELLNQEGIKDCKNQNELFEAAVSAFNRMELNEAWYKRLCENRIIVAKQLDAMTELMENWVKKENSIDSKLRIKKAKITQCLKELGVEMSDIHFWENDVGIVRLELRVRSRWGREIQAENIKQAVEKGYGRPLRLSRESQSVVGDNYIVVEMYEETNYYALSGIATQRKQGSVVSGDNFSIFELENGSYNVCLSDGMGSGKSASRESEMVVELIEKFVEAGFEKETAIKLMNSAMVLHGENNTFSTLDFAAFDLYSGKLEIIKIGGAATFVKRKKRVDYYMSDSLPTGVDVNQNIKNCKTELEDGDFLVMVTDGVLEYFHGDNPEEEMVKIIKDIQTNNAGVLAKNILDCILEKTGGYAMDDMTVITVGLWEK